MAEWDRHSKRRDNEPADTGGRRHNFEDDGISDGAMGRYVLCLASGLWRRNSRSRKLWAANCN